MDGAGGLLLEAGSVELAGGGQSVGPVAMRAEVFRRLFSHCWFGFGEFYKRQIEAHPDWRDFVELGVWKGHSTAFLARLVQSRPGAVVHAVDLFEQTTDPAILGHAAHGDLPYLREIFHANLDLAGVLDVVRTVVSETAEAAGPFDARSIDFVFVDARHDYASVLADVVAWSPKVRPGGVMAGHDASIGSVKQAITEHFGADRVQFDVMQDVWWVEF